MDEQDLINLKNKIDEAKTSMSELKGRKQALMDNLNKTYGCKTIAEAEKLIQKLEKQIADLEDEKKKSIDKLQEEFDL